MKRVADWLWPLALLLVAMMLSTIPAAQRVEELMATFERHLLAVTIGLSALGFVLMMGVGHRRQRDGQQLGPDGRRPVEAVAMKTELRGCNLFLTLAGAAGILLSSAILHAQKTTEDGDGSENSWVLWLYLGITVLANMLSLVTLVFFLRGVRRSGHPVLSASKTFLFSLALFLIPGIALVLMMFLGMVAAAAGTDARLAAIGPANAVMALVVVTLAYRRTRRKLQLAARP